MANGKTPCYDYIIVGSGIAGLYTALLARELGTVLVLTKNCIKDSNTINAQGGIAAAVGEGDSPELHFQDTMTAGAGLCDPEAVQILVNEAADRIVDLVRLGITFDTIDEHIALTREAAHTVPRILHVGGDATGEYIETTLIQRVCEAGIQVSENCLAIQILLDGGRLEGIKVLDCYSGSIQEYRCGNLVIATGGAGRLFKYTTNPEVANGSGIALAFNAGIKLTDMEFFQFHPTALHLPGVSPFLISESVRGEGGILRNEEKRAFMYDYSPDGELAPRDVVARSIIYEMNKTNSDHVFLDITHLPSSLVITRFPHIFHFCLKHGLDMTREPIPVAPAAHFSMGGIMVNAWGETNIPGIYAAGEVACAGVHGANRLASNSLLAALVISKRIIEKSRRIRNEAQTGIAAIVDIHVLPERKPLKVAPRLSISSMQSLMWEKVGIIRTKEGLTEAADTLAAWQATLPETTNRASFELESMIICARLMTEAALLREESRGAHFRTDFPEPSADWIRHITFKLSR